VTLTIETYVLGPIENNTYLIIEPVSKTAAVVDPSAPSREILERIRKNGFHLEYLLITHAHFDHIGGVKWFKHQFNDKPKSILHSADLELWSNGGGSKYFGFDFDTGGQPDLLIEENQNIELGNHCLSVLHTPGHTPGHVTFYSNENNAAFCGDLIFFHGVGRTDMHYSDELGLVSSIKKKIFTLPDQTILFPGHGPSTTVLEEKENNPFI